MERPQVLQHLDTNLERMFEASIRTFASQAVAIMVSDHRLDPAHAQPCGDWITHTIRADFHSEQASKICEETKLSERLLAEALEATLEKMARDAHK